MTDTMKSQHLVRNAALPLLVLLVVGFLHPTRAARVPRIDELDAPDVLRAMSRGFADLSARVAPSVVSIRSGLEEPTIGSGVVFTVEGHVLTSHHVLAGGEPHRVTLLDGRTFTGHRIGSDEATDLAVLRLPVELDTVPHFGAADAMRVGEWVMAIGNPYGLSHSVSAGILSAKERTGLGLLELESFLQTDARIDQGNSGGVLVDLDGRVIGICSALERDPVTGRSTMGFAVPIEVARRVAEDLILHGRVVRGWLGVDVRALSPALARAWSLDPEHAVRIVSVDRDSPADRAGLRPGDVLWRVNGEPVSAAHRFARDVQARRPGDRMACDVWRDGKSVRVLVVLEEVPRK